MVIVKDMLNEHLTVVNLETTDPYFQSLDSRIEEMNHEHKNSVNNQVFSRHKENTIKQRFRAYDKLPTLNR